MRSFPRRSGAFAVLVLGMTLGRALFAPPERRVEVDFSRFAPRVFMAQPIDAALTLGITHPAGIAYYRLATNVAPGQMAALVRADVEQINVVARLDALAQLLQRTSANQIYWENLFLLWNSYIPDNEGADIGRIRQIAIDLQNLDVTGDWNYAQLRQKVHNFPSAALVEELDALLKAAEKDLEALGPAPARNEDATPERLTAVRRVNWLRELLGLERQFWYGAEMAPETVAQILETFGGREEAARLAFRDSDHPLARAEKLLGLREFLRHRVGIGGRSVARLMELDRALTAAETQTLLTVFMFDRRLALEIGRLLSRLTPEELQTDPSGKLILAARILALDYLASDKRIDELKGMARDIRKYTAEIQRTLGQPISDLQARFFAMREHVRSILDQIPEAGATQWQRPRAQVGSPDRLGALADGEMRQSILFNIAAIGQAVLRAHQERLDLKLEDVNAGRMTNTDVLREPSQPIVGKVVVAEKEADLQLATRYIADGENVILVKLMGYDIELPPVSCLITVDPALNQASHMAMRAESARIPHLNVLDHRSQLLAHLVARRSKEVSLVIAPGRPRTLVVTQGNGTGEVTGQPRLRLEGAFDDNYADPTPLSQLIDTEERLGARISGGKGRGLAFLLRVADPGEAEALGIPAGIQIPYGFFLEWFQAIGIKEKWETALKSPPGNVVWREVLTTIKDEAIPPRLIDKLLNRYLNDGRDLPLGWFIRSNSNSEDGQFNAAGVNRTRPDVRAREDLEAALKEVFFSTYAPSARVWWHRVFENPEAVRSTVLMMQTVVSTHSSVAIISADGTRLSVESLPGIEENVVGGNGIAERLLFEGDDEPILVQQAWATELRVWARPDQPNRAVERRALIYQGRVLSPKQREAARALLRTVRKVADRVPELKGKHLDVELAWEGDKPRVVQVRPAPSAPPPKPGLREPIPAPEATAQPSGELRELSPLALLESVETELEEGAPFLDSTVFKLGLGLTLARTLLAPDEADRRAEALLAKVSARAAQAFEQAANGTITVEEARRRALTCRGMLRQFVEGNRNPTIPFRSPEGERMLAALVKYFSNPALEPGDEANLMINTAQLLFGGEERMSFNQAWRERFLELLGDEALARIPVLIPHFSDDDVEHHLDGLMATMASSDEAAARAAFRRFQGIARTLVKAEGWENTLNHVAGWVADHLAVSFSSRVLDGEYVRVRERVLARARCPISFSESYETGAVVEGLTSSFESAYAVLRLPARFLTEVIEDEAKKARDARSLQRLVGALASLRPEWLAYPELGALLKRASQLLNESGVKVELKPWRGETTFEVVFSISSERLRFASSADVNPALLLHLDSLTIVDEPPPEEAGEDRADEVLAVGALPPAAKVASSYAKVAAAWVSFRRSYWALVGYPHRANDENYMALHRDWHRYMMRVLGEALKQEERPGAAEWKLILLLYVQLLEDRSQDGWELQDKPLVSA